MGGYRFNISFRQIYIYIGVDTDQTSYSRQISIYVGVDTDQRSVLGKYSSKQGWIQIKKYNSRQTVKQFKLLPFFCPSLFNFPPSLLGGQVITEGGKHVLSSFIMICLSELFWHCIFSKTVSPNPTNIQELSDDMYLYLPPGSTQLGYEINA